MNFWHKYRATVIVTLKRAGMVIAYTSSITIVARRDRQHISKPYDPQRPEAAVECGTHLMMTLGRLGTPP